MDERTTQDAFWAVVKTVDAAEADDKPIPASVPKVLRRIYQADLQHLLEREKHTANVTCARPAGKGIKGVSESMKYIFDDTAHADLELEPGRKCEGGECCADCSRNVFPRFANDVEVDLDVFKEMQSFSFNELETVSASTILNFVRLIERVRRAIAHEYGLPLETVLPLQAYSRKYVAGTTQQGGGGGEGDFVILHTDEATHSGYHYSCVIYLSTQGVDFEGGNFVFNDPAGELGAGAHADEGGSQATATGGAGIEDAAGTGLETPFASFIRGDRQITPFHPSRGAAVIFSSGWENMHEVEPLTSGVRYAVPCFFTTCPVPKAAYDQMYAGIPADDDAVADDLLHLLLAHREETPLEGTARVKELMMKWHFLCA